MTSKSKRRRLKREREAAAVERAKICPYCGIPARLTDGVEVYGRSYGRMMWLCSNYPKCDARVGCHPRTDKPMGGMANRELRDARMAAHAAFDRLWKSGAYPRKKAYWVLANAMGMTKDECHIGQMTLEQACRVLEVMEQFEDTIYMATNHGGAVPVRSLQNVPNA